ncbi:DUF2254 domain-containing protein [Desulfomicrobium baculatum]|uniref:DUF2254 domain-containing protein n=1 Tax=Desulfomicrobium baculatum (strain DSM 4028 / VKM B-1378 / X) TaxID=525897 RepID=C7LQ42_DESBD|nr:DUF2254 domain-containing protein [Desulfomicrobium baculatum]ACU89068.1 conserved hypothetical protein [Desulfomicrobium baculatum DSM 4028]
MNKLRQLWSNLRSSFWFVPSLIVVFSIALAVALVEADSAGSDLWLARWPRLFGAGVEGARGMMSTIAGSMMTVVGVTFSMILVVLALASSQYSSRILRNFMRSRVTQVVLGIFAGIFTYSLIVLRTIRGGDEGAFVPSLAVFFGFVLALGGVGALMFFIHYIASSIQASNIIASVASETVQAIERLFPENPGQEPADSIDDPSPDLLAERSWRTVLAGKSGYIQIVDNDALMRVAQDMDTIVRMERGIGEFVVRDTALVSLALRDPLDQETVAALQATFTISRHRTVEQDAAFGIRQIVDVALKALSPGINDTTTAVMCVDYLTVILARLAPRRITSLYRYGEERLRVIARGPGFESLLTESFDQIRGNASGNFVIMSRMIDAILTLAGLTTTPQRRRALLDQVQWIAELAGRTLEAKHDRTRINTQITRVREMLESEPALCAKEGKPHSQACLPNMTA